MDKKKDKISCGKILKEFKEYSSSEELKKYEEIRKAYSEIRSFYEKKVIDDEIDLKIEKIRLQGNFGKQFAASISYIITFGIFVIGVLLSVLIQQTFKNINTYYWILNFIIIGILYFYSVYSIGKEVKKDRTRDVMINISLKVIEELEKEISKNEAKEEKEANREKTIEQIKEHIDNNNVMRNTVLPVIAEIAATAVVKKGIFNKFITKIKEK